MERLSRSAATEGERAAAELARKRLVERLGRDGVDVAPELVVEVGAEPTGGRAADPPAAEGPTTEIHLEDGFGSPEGKTPAEVLPPSMPDRRAPASVPPAQPTPIGVVPQPVVARRSARRRSSRVEGPPVTEQGTVVGPPPLDPFDERTPHLEDSLDPRTPPFGTPILEGPRTPGPGSPATGAGHRPPDPYGAHWSGSAPNDRGPMGSSPGPTSSIRMSGAWNPPAPSSSVPASGPLSARTPEPSVPPRRPVTASAPASAPSSGLGAPSGPGVGARWTWLRAFGIGVLVIGALELVAFLAASPPSALDLRPEAAGPRRRPPPERTGQACAAGDDDACALVGALVANRLEKDPDWGGPDQLACSRADPMACKRLGARFVAVAERVVREGDYRNGSSGAPGAGRERRRRIHALACRVGLVPCPE